MSNKICQMLGIKSPIIQLPIHTLTNGKMVAAISEAGALGILGINSGYQITADVTSSASISDSDQVGTIAGNSILDTMTERNLMNEQIDDALENTFRPFGIEIASTETIPQNDPTATALVQLMRKRRLTIALFEGFGKVVSKPWLKFLHQNGIRVMQAIRNIADVKIAINNGIDIIINKDKNNLSEFVKIANNIPVLAGDNITSPSAVGYAFKHGAEGIAPATIFAVTKEAPTSPKIKIAITKAKNNELVDFKTELKTIYSLPGKLPNKLFEMTKKGESATTIFNTANRYQGLINGMAKGNLTNGYTDIANNIEPINEIKTAEETINELNSGIPKEKL